MASRESALKQLECPGLFDSAVNDSDSFEEQNPRNGRRKNAITDCSDVAEKTYNNRDEWECSPNGKPKQGPNYNGQGVGYDCGPEMENNNTGSKQRYSAGDEAKFRRDAAAGGDDYGGYYSGEEEDKKTKPAQQIPEDKQYTWSAPSFPEPEFPVPVYTRSGGLPDPSTVGFCKPVSKSGDCVNDNDPSKVYILSPDNGFTTQAENANNHDLIEKIKTALSVGGKLKELYDSGKKIIVAIKEGRYDYKPKLEDETVDIYKNVKKDIDFLKVARKEIAEAMALELVGELSSVSDIALKGPAYISPATALIFEKWQEGIDDNLHGDYGTNVFDNVSFKIADEKGYDQISDFVKKIGNKAKIAFAYSTEDIICMDGIIQNKGTDGEINMIDANLATLYPLSKVELDDISRKDKRKYKYAYRGIIVGDKFVIKRKYRL